MREATAFHVRPGKLRTQPTPRASTAPRITTPRATAFVWRALQVTLPSAVLLHVWLALPVRTGIPSPRTAPTVRTDTTLSKWRALLVMPALTDDGPTAPPVGLRASRVPRVRTSTLLGCATRTMAVLWADTRCRATPHVRAVPKVSLPTLPKVRRAMLASLASIHF